MPFQTTGAPTNVVDPHSTPDDARVVAEHALGRRAVSAERDQVGASNDVYFVALQDGDRCVVRIGRAEWRHLVPQEVWAVGRVRALGVPAPDVLAADWSLSRFPWPYTVARRLPGRVVRRRDLSARQTGLLLEQMGGYLRLIHGVELSGHGTSSSPATATSAATPRPGRRCVTTWSTGSPTSRPGCCPRTGSSASALGSSGSAGCPRRT